MDNKKSDGVLVLGIMAIIFGIWSLVYYLSSDFVFLRNPQLYSELSQFKSAMSSRFTYLGVIISPIVYLLFIISGLGVLKLKNWCRNLLILISVIQLANSLIVPYIWASLMSSATHQALVIPTPIPTLYIINIWFFARKATKEQFKKQ